MKKLIAWALSMTLLAAGSAMAAAPNPKTKAAPPPQPEKVTIGAMSHWYGPVEFSHGKHAGLAGDCTSCHHKSDGQAGPCSTCHQPQGDPGDASVTTLKVAYHTRCMDCHKAAGSGPTDCTGCHARKAIPAPPEAAGTAKKPS